MCEAIEAILKDSRAEGKAEGIREGKLSTLANLAKDGLLNVRDAAVRARMTEDEFRDAMKKLA